MDLPRGAGVERGSMSIPLSQHVESEIRAIFSRVAEMVGRGEVAADLGPDDTAGLPLALMDAEQVMVTVWRQYVDAPKEAEKDAALCELADGGKCCCACDCLVEIRSMVNFPCDNRNGWGCSVDPTEENVVWAGADGAADTMHGLCEEWRPREASE
jgi:hypothetical protein